MEYAGWIELSLDARHLLSGSGVASFMYSKKTAQYQ